ncbi:hypothetical protein GOODEAATRI_023442 [Goodea atripinnis]|uniref:Uncharacterized protein n=1 Tax=Goodea atripinnis TaxID=208336 RepID=A0ABV0PGD5_9TELE
MTPHPEGGWQPCRTFACSTMSTTQRKRRCAKRARPVRGPANSVDITHASGMRVVQQASWAGVNRPNTCRSMSLTEAPAPWGLWRVPTKLSLLRGHPAWLPEPCHPTSARKRLICRGGNHDGGPSVRPPKERKHNQTVPETTSQKLLGKPHHHQRQRPLSIGLGQGQALQPDHCPSHPGAFEGAPSFVPTQKLAGSPSEKDPSSSWSSSLDLPKYQRPGVSPVHGQTQLGVKTEETMAEQHP